VWLDPARTSPYQFRQFWVQCDDAMVATYLKMLSMRPLDEIDALIEQQAAAPERRPAQRALAEEMTTLVHGQDAAVAAREAADVLFGADPTRASQAALEAVAAEVPRVVLPNSLDGVRVHEMLVQTGIAKSNSEVSRLLSQGAIRAGNRILDSDGLLTTSDLLRGQFLLLRKGKRDFVVGKSLTEG
jgi:tyrosyl-tRNA synthetase